MNYFKLFYQETLGGALRGIKINEYIKNINVENIEILDYGAGKSPYKNLFKNKFSIYKTADYFDTMIEYNIESCDYLIDTQQKTDIEENSFDIVLFTEVMEHIYEPEKALNEINRILKPNGYLLGSVPFVQDEHVMPYDFYRYTSVSLNKMFKESGFEVIRFDYLGDCISAFSTLFYHNLRFIKKIFFKIKLYPVGLFIFNLLRFPEFILYILYLIKFDLFSNKYFKSYPLGFSFLLKKTNISN
jgi:ubiquinone/menaquinone biosynthesis C-methylase UbiE